MKQLLFILLLFAGLSAYSQESPSLKLNSSEQVIKERQHSADQGNGYYLNPIIPGNYGDPSIVRVGKDYYMAFSRGNGFILWQSRDLINWKPVVKHIFRGDYSMIWAVDLQYFNGKFHLYMPINNYPGKKQKPFGNFVSISERPEGPWSEPIDLEIPVPDAVNYSAIDPGFIQTPEGKKYIYVHHGFVAELNDDGTKAISTPKLVYNGWQYPPEWNVECMCLESPKLFYRDGFYYLVSAEGGTSGPSTAHMTVVARSKSPEGPWINSPYNPLTHTYSISEKWWHQGHGTIFEATDGTWWTVYHARLNSYPEIGRQTLLMPVEWTVDGWPVIKWGLSSSGLLPLPPGENIGNGMVLSDDFRSEKLSIQWDYLKSDADKIKSGNGSLVIEAKGENHRDARALTVGATNKSFEVSVEVFCKDTTSWGGIALAGDAIMTNGLRSTFGEGSPSKMLTANFPAANKGHMFLKIINYQKDLSFYFSDDGTDWKPFMWGQRSNTSYNIRLFAWGKGQVSFRNFRYQGLE